MSWILRLSPWHDPDAIAKSQAETARVIEQGRNARLRADAVLADRRLARR